MHGERIEIFTLYFEDSPQLEAGRFKKSGEGFFDTMSMSGAGYSFVRAALLCAFFLLCLMTAHFVRK